MTNFYIGAFEYSIIFMDGQHHIIDIEADEIIFSGTYESCLTERESLQVDFLLSRF